MSESHHIKTISQDKEPLKVFFPTNKEDREILINVIDKHLEHYAKL